MSDSGEGSKFRKNEFFPVSIRSGVVTRSQASLIGGLLSDVVNDEYEIVDNKCSIGNENLDSDTSSVDDFGENEEGDNNLAMAERSPLIVPSKFKGEPEENVVGYLTSFERAAKANNWDNARKLVVLPCYLEGAALQWFENFERAAGDNALTWERVVNGLKSAFQTIALEEQLEYRLRMRMQKDTESVESYVQDVLSLCSRVDPTMTERVKIKHVLRGLIPSLLEKVMLMENETIEQLTNNIRKLQTARYLAGQRVDQVLGMGSSYNTSTDHTSQPTTSAPTTLESQVAALASAFDKLNMRILEQGVGNDRTPRYYLRSERPTRGQSNEEGPTHHNRGQTPQRGPGRGRGGMYRGRGGRTRDGRVICYNCGRVGHYAVSCHDSRGSPNDRSQGNEPEEH